MHITLDWLKLIELELFVFVLVFALIYAISFSYYCADVLHGDGEFAFFVLKLKSKLLNKIDISKIEIKNKFESVLVESKAEFVVEFFEYFNLPDKQSCIKYGLSKIDQRSKYSDYHQMILEEYGLIQMKAAVMEMLGQLDEARQIRKNEYLRDSQLHNQAISRVRLKYFINDGVV